LHGSRDTTRHNITIHIAMPLLPINNAHKKRDGEKASNGKGRLAQKNLLEKELK
jgi:hypothetical protein